MASDWDQRQLCPDGGCIGVIGGDGTCTVCGRAAPNWGDERRRGKRTTAEVEPEVAAPAGEAAVAADDDEEYEDDDEEYEDDDEDEDEDEAAAAPDAAPASPSAGGDEFDQRKLCPDGGCIGVIGDDGRCRVCHKKAS